MDKYVWWATVSVVAKSPTGRLTTPPSLVPGPPAQLHQSDRPCVSNKLQGEANTAGGGDPPLRSTDICHPPKRENAAATPDTQSSGGTYRALTSVREGSMTLVGRFPGPPEPRATPRSGRTASRLDARSQLQRGHNAQRTRQPGCETIGRGGGRTPNPTPSTLSASFRLLRLRPPSPFPAPRAPPPPLRIPGL